eukprot:6396295-Lingulodinium_polyedra.AAC.1
MRARLLEGRRAMIQGPIPELLVDPLAVLRGQPGGEARSASRPLVRRDAVVARLKDLGVGLPPEAVGRQ